MSSDLRIINVHTHLHHSQDVDARVKHWRECDCIKVCVHVLVPDNQKNDRTCSNEQLRGWMEKYPDIICGFAQPNLGYEVDVPDRIDAFKEQGFTGLKFIRSSYPYDDERYFPLYERAQALGMPILFHTGFLSIGADDGELGVSQNKMRAIRLDTIGRAFPNLRIMMAHLGNPEFHVGLDIIRSFPNIYGEYSGASGSKFRETTLRKVFAPLPGADMKDPEENQALIHFEKLCFATDNPEPPRWIAMGKRIMGELELPEELQERFWWKNAAEWLGLTELD